MKVKFNILFSFLLLVAIAVPLIGLAQGDPGGDPDAPIDGGLSLLLAAGAAYGVKKYRDNKKQEAEK